MFGFDTYEVYAADSEHEAMDFLKNIRVEEPQYYVVVDVPSGAIGRDRNGIYRPSTSWRGADWSASRYEDYDLAGRKHFWTHWKDHDAYEPESTGKAIPLGEEQKRENTRKKWWRFWT